jgi:hypothetical protein
LGELHAVGHARHELRQVSQRVHARQRIGLCSVVMACSGTPAGALADRCPT